jgi:hypothetical protein
VNADLLARLKEIIEQLELLAEILRRSVTRGEVSVR